MCRLAYPYVEGSSGWGVSTTKQEPFCEMKYYITPYIAEFVSTISNFAYIYLGVYGISKMRKSKQDNSILWSYISLATVGVGSSAFHATVTYTGQIADEISMLYATATIAYAVFSVDRDAVMSRFIAVLLSIIVAAITAIHIYRGESTVFQLSWASMVVAIFVQCKRQSPKHVPAGKSSEEMSTLVRWGTVSFLTGFLLWNIDNVMCSWLLAFRSAVGMPWGFVTELHGWWHILTAFGVYYFVVFIHYWRIIAKTTIEAVPSSRDSRSSQQTTTYALVWPKYHILPYLAAAKANGKTG